MDYKYGIEGLHCGSCVKKVTDALSTVDGISAVEVDLKNNQLRLETEESVPITKLNKVLAEKDPRYVVHQAETQNHNHSEEAEQVGLERYKPVFLIFAYIALVVTLALWSQGNLHLFEWMRYFMAGFFIVFSFFKMLNLKGFASQYAAYDVIAAKIPIWGYIYAFLELAFGILLLLNIEPIWTLSAIVVVMTISLIGVLKSVLNKEKIQCACLGDVFDLPMSVVTIIEDGLMIAMSLFMLAQLIN